MEMISRIAINAVIIFLAAFMGVRACSKLFRPDPLPDRCSPKMQFVNRLIVIWCVGFLLLTWEWITNGRVFMLPIQVEIFWSLLMVLNVAIYKEILDTSESCPIGRPIGEILIHEGIATEEDIKKVLKIQTEEKEGKTLH